MKANRERFAVCLQLTLPLPRFSTLKMQQTNAVRVRMEDTRDRLWRQYATVASQIDKEATDAADATGRDHIPEGTP